MKYFFYKKKIIRTFRIRPGTSDNQRKRKIGWYVQSLREVHTWLIVLSKRWSSITAFPWLGLVYDSMFQRIRFGKRHLRNVLIVRVPNPFQWIKFLWTRKPRDYKLFLISFVDEFVVTSHLRRDLRTGNVGLTKKDKICFWGLGRYQNR